MRIFISENVLSGVAVETGRFAKFKENAKLGVYEDFADASTCRQLLGLSDAVTSAKEISIEQHLPVHRPV